MLRPILVLLSPVLAVLAFMAIAGAALGAPPPSECRVTSYTGDIYRPGSGTVIAAGGGDSRVLTCFHVTNERPDKIVVTYGGKEYPATLVAWDSTVDLACVEVKGVELPVAQIARTYPAIGATLAQWGHANESAAPVAKTGSADAYGTAADELFTSIRAEPGDSGCGVFDGSGELVGVCSNRRVDRQGALVVGLGAVREFFGIGPAQDKPVLRQGEAATNCPTGST